MKRHTKKGPRRSAQMPVTTKRFVVTDYDGCSYITAGKVYKLDLDSPWGFGIVSDQGRDLCIRYTGNVCSHLDDVGMWRWAKL